MAFWRRQRTSGLPASSNRASSMHLWWDPDPGPVAEVAAVLEVVEPPSVDRLYFWALQVSFVDRGRTVGGAHLGLQWYSRHPGMTAVNWGGYRQGGGELDGETSPLPSATGNPNTRDFTWHPHRRYRLRVSSAGEGVWAGEVTDLTTDEVTLVRRLAGGGTALSRPGVWSEVFARCDEPTTTVRWSGFTPAPDALRVTYQSHADGGCANTTATADGDGVRQTTTTDRTTPDSARITLQRD